MVKKLFIASLLVSTLPIFAEVSTKLSQEVISEFETVKLTITLDGLAPRDEPDFSALNTDFDVLNTQRSGRTRVINNTFESIVEWTLELRPKRTAELKIPSIDIGKFKTEELTLTVGPMTKDMRDKMDQEVFWITKVDRTEQYVHGGIHAERKLYYSNNVDVVGLGRRGLPGPGLIENAHIVELGVRAATWEPRNGRTYSVGTQEFVIFAERSGTISLPQISVRAQIKFDDRTVLVFVHTEEHEITILPRPAEYPEDIPWLPATRVVVTDDLEKLDLSNIEVGDSFSRRTTIEAIGSYSTGVPGIETELPEGIRSYPTTPDFSNEILGNRIIGTRTDERAFVVTKAGDTQIPDAEIVWWNTNTNQVERTVVPGRTFTVFPSSSSDASFTSNYSSSSGNASAGGQQGPAATFLGTRSLSDWLILFAVGGWLLSFVLVSVWLWGRYTESKKAKTTSEEDVHIDTLLKSSSGRDVKEGMLRWLTAKLNISRVNAIHLLQDNRTTATVLRSVNDHQYGTSGQSDALDRKEIKRALHDIEKEFQQQRAQTTTFWQFYQPT
ncbi:MAG: protein BatD [Gammaproteobacteria bacterium]|nr:protein BatD [Gammaproteobacteria bacterium]MYF39135.1 protein BatD [Gammaproteobacteria bacterium]